MGWDKTGRYQYCKVGQHSTAASTAGKVEKKYDDRVKNWIGYKWIQI